jgi:hypothetical protein
MLRQRVERELAALAALNEVEPSIFPRELAAALRKMECRVESDLEELPQQFKVTMSMNGCAGTRLKIEVTYSEDSPPTFHCIQGGASFDRRCGELNGRLKNIWDCRASDCFAAACFPYLTRHSLEEKLESIKLSLSRDSTLIISIGCAGGAQYCQFLPPNCHHLLGAAAQSPPVIVSECATPFPHCNFVTFCVGAACGSRHL